MGRTWQEELELIEEERVVDALIAQMRQTKEGTLNQLEETPVDDEIWDKLTALLSGDAEAENERLRQQRDVLLDALKTMVVFDPIVPYQIGCRCFHCRARALSPSELQHKSDCPFLKARRAIAAARGEEE